MARNKSIVSNNTIKRNPFKSTTFWFSLIALLLIPFSFWIDNYFKMKLLSLALKSNKSINEFVPYIVNIPIAQIITLATIITGGYVAKRLGSNISETFKKTKEDKDI